MAGESATLPGAAPKEVLARAATTSRERLGVNTRARQLREAVEKSPDKPAADALKEEVEGSAPIDAEAGKTARERNIGTGRDPKTKDLSADTPEGIKDRDKSVNKTIELLDKLDKNGYDKLDRTEQEDIRRSIEDFIASSPTLSVLHPEGPQRVRAAEYFIKNPKMIKKSDLFMQLESQRDLKIQSRM